MKYVLALLLLTLATHIQAHTLAPSHVNIRTVDDSTVIRMQARNNFDQPATYLVIGYEDLDGTKPLKELYASPSKFLLPANSARKFIARINLPPELDEFWLCTRRVPSLRETTVMPTEVCSKITIKHKSYKDVTNEVSTPSIAPDS